MLYRNGIYNCVLVYATLFTWKARRQRQKVLATLLRCAPWQRDSRIYVNCGWDRSRHGSIRSHVFIPRSSPCLRLSASRCIGALCSCRWWRTTAGTYPETQILHSWTLRLMQGISEHVWQQLSPISSGKSYNKQLVYNDAFNTRAGTQYQHIWMSRCRNFLRKSSAEGRCCRTTFVCFYVRVQLIIFCRWWNPVSTNRQVDQILCSSIFSCVFSDRQITILFGGPHFRVLFGYSLLGLVSGSVLKYRKVWKFDAFFGACIKINMQQIGLCIVCVLILMHPI